MGRPFLIAGAEKRRTLQGGGVFKRALKAISDERDSWAKMVIASAEQGRTARNEYLKGVQDTYDSIIDLLLSMLPDPARKDGEDGETESGNRQSD